MNTPDTHGSGSPEPTPSADGEPAGRPRDDAVETGRFAYAGLDRLLHEKARLGIMTSLLTHEDGLLFNDLKGLCSLTDGNLSRHLHILCDASLVEGLRGEGPRRPPTRYRLTTEGRERFREYLSELEQVIADAQRAHESSPAVRVRDVPPGWLPA